MSTKRSAEAHALHASPESSSKKPRFDYRNPSTLAADAPEEDAILDLDEIGKPGQQTKRNAVKLDGYDTDSSNENFDVRAAAKAQSARQQGKNGGAAGKSGAEEENDMFADLEDDMAGGPDGDEDEQLAREGKKAKKDVRFLDTGDIEGQVHSSRSGGHVSADFTPQDRDSKGKSKLSRQQDKDAESSSESGGDDDRAAIDPEVEDAEELGAGAKKHHAPKLDAFNMQQEGEEGRFDDAGNYVRKAADPDAVHDNWLDGLSKKDMKKAKEAQEKRDQDRRRKTAEDDALLTSDLLSTLIGQLQTGETTLEALQRLGTGKQKKKTKPKQKWARNKEKKNGQPHGDEMDVDPVDKESEDPAETRRRVAVEAITGAADQLFSRDQQEVYEQEREVLMRQYRRETGEDWAEPARPPDGDLGPAAQWEYRWSDARDGGETHGPYDGPTMHSWNEAGYFGEGVEFRRIGEVEWSRSVAFLPALV